MTKPIDRDPMYRKRVFDADIIELCVRWYITYRTILVWAWSAAPWLVAESGMGNGTRIEEGHEARKAAN